MSDIQSILVQTPDDIGDLQPRWDKKMFDDAITDKGYLCYIDRALMCPCKAQGNGSALTDCRNCQGTGWFFVDRKKTKILCSSISNRNKYEVWSETNRGTVNISMRAQDKIGNMDKITLLELESWFSQILYLKNSLLGVDDPNNDYMFAFTIYEPLEINNLYVFAGSNLPLIYISSNDYKCVRNKLYVKKTAFIGITNPCVSIDYRHNPVYHTIDINRDLIKQKDGNSLDAQGVSYAINCIGRRAHYVLDAPLYENDFLFDNTNYSKTSLIT